MRKIIIILLALISMTGYAQWGELVPKPKKVFFERVPEPVKTITICVTSITLDALGDAWIADGKNTSMAHSFQAASTGILLTTPFVIDLEKRHWLPYCATYVSFRIALFDPVYNMARYGTLEHRSNSNTWDKALTVVSPPDGIMFFGRCIFLGVAIAIPIQELSK